MQEAIRKSDVLIEALPYIRAFQEKIIVIKYGGSAIVNRDKRRNVLEDVVFMSYAGMKPVIVHGGGPFITKKMKKLGRRQKFVNGLRVTSERDIHIIKDVLAGVNRQIVKQIRALGGRAQGFLRRNYCIRTKRHRKFCDIGLVGEVVSIDTDRINAVLQKGFVPVISPLGIGRDKKTYNINADQASAAIAGALSAEKLAFLTNVEGILMDSEDKNTLIPTLDIKKVRRLIDRRVISGGMIPKVRACISALKKGVKKVHIVNANLPHALLLEIFTDEGIGTQILR